MWQKIQRIRDKYTYWLLLLFIPLAVLPFFFEPDSMMGKSLLLIKAALFGVLYIFYANKQKWYVHVMLLITCASMGVSIMKHGGAGTALLILTMFFALITFPRITVKRNDLGRLYLLLGIDVTVVILVCMIINYSKGLPAFSWRGEFNTNTIGILLLAAFFFFESALHADGYKLRVTFTDAFVYLCILFLAYKSGCRSVLLSLFAFVICYFVSVRTKQSNLLYILLALFSVGICLITYFIYNNDSISNQIVGVELLGKAILSGREKIWSLIFTGCRESPLFGKGIEYIAETTGLESAHNVFMGVLLFGGVIPTLMYLYLLFSGKYILLGNREKTQNVQMQKIAFMSCIIVSAFECIFTDNRLNMLFFPLLLCSESTIQKTADASEESEVMAETVDNTKGKARPGKCWNVLALSATCILILTYLFEPIAHDAVRENVPMIMNKTYLDEIGYDADKYGNVLGNQDYSSEKMKGVVWEWDGSAYIVTGQTNTTTSFANLFSSTDSLPEWAIPGKQYHLVYEAQSVRCRIYCYDTDGKSTRIVDTKNSIDFTIPVGCVGIVVRIALPAGTLAFEKVMPIIYSLELE